GKACYELVHHSTNPPGFCPHGSLLGDGKEHAQEIHEDTLNADFLVTASPLHDEEGNVTGSVHVMRDITELKTAADALRLANNKLTMLSSIARLSARTRSNLVTTTNDALTYLTAGDTTRGEYIRAGREVDYLPEKTQFIAQQDRMAYMVGMRHVISAEEVSGTVLLGRFGSEYLLVGDKLAQRDLPQVVGSSQVEALPLMVSTAGLENVLIGEEIYAAPAYLDHAPSHLASLQVQDWLRGGIIVLIVLGLLVATFGITIGDYFLR
ncbi:MAG: DUF6754 domain-containing protein, partial [Chloroflexota bacterium]